MVKQGSQGNTDSSLAGAGSVAGASVSETTAISDPEQAGPSRALESQGQPNSELVQQVFGLFKTYLTSQLDENGKQLQTVQDRKKACEFKSRGNRQQFEFNASVDVILTDIASKAYSPDEVKSLANEGKEKIRKRRKLVKLADRNKNGWLVVQEYESDDLASNSEDEKKIKKAKTAAEKKRKVATPHGSSCNPFKKSKISGDNQLFHGKTFPKCLCRARPLPKILC